jgi:hypothetical protein
LQIRIFGFGNDVNVLDMFSLVSNLLCAIERKCHWISSQWESLFKLLFSCWQNLSLKFNLCVECEWIARWEAKTFHLSIGGSMKECKAKLQGATKQVCDCSKLVQAMWSKSHGFEHFICICNHA